MFEGPNFLRLAYMANILILAPVLWSMFFSGGTETVFQGKLTDSEGLRLLVASLWLAILVCSVAGLSAPALFAPLLVVQIIYKATWLATWVWPSRHDPGIPLGISVIFLLIVLVWPVLLWFSGVWRSAS